MKHTASALAQYSNDENLRPTPNCWLVSETNNALVLPVALVSVSQHFCKNCLFNMTQLSFQLLLYQLKQTPASGFQWASPGCIMNMKNMKYEKNSQE